MQILSKLKLLLLITGVFLLSIPIAQGQDLAAKKINLNINDASIKTAIAEIQKQSGIKFYAGEDIIKYASVRVNIAANDITVKDAITRTLSGTNLRYEQDGDHIVIEEKPAAPATPAARPQTGQATGVGSLTGTILEDNGQPLVGATVSVPGTSLGVTAGPGGKYTLNGIPVGTTVIRFSFMGFETYEVTDVKFTAGRSTTLDVVMKASALQLEGVVVRGTFNRASAEGLYAVQKNMAAMSDGVSADLIKKTSDNNVAQVLKRVSGVTMDDGKYVIVRGMSERYNNVQLNGASMPSTEPNRRNFSFDVIPTGLVDNVTISKTFTPDMQGEFTGGMVEVNTLAVPDEKFLSIGAGSGMNTLSTGKEFMSNRRYAADWLFGGIEDRQWYTDKDRYTGILNNNSVNGDRVAQKNTYALGATKAAPLMSFSATGGDNFDLGRGNTLGFVAAATYRHEENREEMVEGHMITRDSLYTPGGNRNWRWKAVTTTGAVLNAGWRNSNHSITWRNLFNNRFENKSQQRYIHKYYEGYDFAEIYISPLRSQLWQMQLNGRHNLLGGKLIATWNASYSDLVRTNPDERLAKGHIIGEAPNGELFIDWGRYSTDLIGSPEDVASGFAEYSELHETKATAAFNLEHPFTVDGNRQSIKAGYMGTFRDVDYQQQYLKPLKHSSNDKSINDLSLEDYFSPAHFAEGGTLIYRSTFFGWNQYTGDQSVHAAYLMGEFSFFRKLRAIAGVRMESNRMTVVSPKWKQTAVDDAAGTYVDSVEVAKYLDWLPSATLIYSITPQVNLRASYSKTLARPDFRELSYSQYYNVDDRVTIINQARLEQTSIDNFDVRAEWYPGAGEVVSVGYFHKKFRRPVEMIMRMLQDGQNFELYTVNLHDAVADGIEVNVRKNFGFITPALRDLYFAGNFSWMKGNVQYNFDRLMDEIWNIDRPDEDYSAAENRDRPLQGFSPYTVNAGLQWEGDRFGAAINYNRAGRKLVYAGEEAKYDQYENPRDVLDLQLSARFLKRRNLEVKLNASDILDQDIIIYRNTHIMDYTQENPDPVTGTTGTVYLDTADKGMDYNPGDQIMSRIKKGINITLGVTYKF